MSKIEELTKYLFEFGRLPYLDGEFTFQDRLDNACNLISYHYQDLKGPKKPKPSDAKKGTKVEKFIPHINPVFEGLSANATLKRLCYKLTKVLIEKEQFDQLEIRISRFRFNEAGRPTDDTNPFKTCLSAIFAKHKNVLEGPDKTRFANELFYAYRHFIPIGSLEQFIRFSGSDTIAQKLNQEFVEPLFKKRVKSKLKNCDIDGLRLGEYPRGIDPRDEYKQLMEDLEALGRLAPDRDETDEEKKERKLNKKLRKEQRKKDKMDKKASKV